MKLTQQQSDQFDRDGYLFFPSLFSAQEMKVLTDEVPRLYVQRRPEQATPDGSGFGHTDHLGSGSQGADVSVGVLSVAAPGSVVVGMSVGPIGALASPATSGFALKAGFSQLAPTSG